MNREELLKIAKPILFNTEMVQAILENRKTVTRRVIKLENGYHLEGNGAEVTENIKLFGSDAIFYNGEETNETLKPPYKADDILYVRETWRVHNHYDSLPPKLAMAAMGGDTWGCIDYKANSRKEEFWGSWRPSIHMPKETARIFLKVTDVKAERLQDIDKLWSNYDKEGMRNPETENISIAMQEKFIDVWNSTIKKQDFDKYGWKANPWAWVIEFERVEVK